MRMVVAMSQCPSCGALADGSYCASCGVPLPSPAYQQYVPPQYGHVSYATTYPSPPFAYPYQYPTRSNELGIIALIFGIMSLFACTLFLVGAIPAVIAIATGYAGRRQGQQYAEAGMWMGVVGFLISTVGWFVVLAVLDSVMGPIW